MKDFLKKYRILLALSLLIICFLAGWTYNYKLAGIDGVWQMVSNVNAQTGQDVFAKDSDIVVLKEIKNGKVADFNYPKENIENYAMDINWRHFKVSKVNSWNKTINSSLSQEDYEKKVRQDLVSAYATASGKSPDEVDKTMDAFFDDLVDFYGKLYQDNADYSLKYKKEGSKLIVEVYDKSDKLLNTMTYDKLSKSESKKFLSNYQKLYQEITSKLTVDSSTRMVTED